MPLYLRGKGSPLLVNLVNTAPLFYENKIVTVHDLSFMHYPKAVSRKFFQYYNFLIPRILKKSLHVFTVSEFAKNDIVETCGILPDKITVVSNAASDQYRVINFGERRRLVLCVGSLQPLKNYSRVLQAFMLLNSPDSELLLVGGKNSKVFPENYNLGGYQDLENVSFTGYKSASELVSLYNEAQVLVIPSLYETFGIPALEAMKCGCTVIASRRGGLPEVCGDSAYYVDPEDVGDISGAISKMLNDKALRQAYVQRGLKNAERFSWKISAERFVLVLSQLVH